MSKTSTTLSLFILLIADSSFSSSVPGPSIATYIFFVISRDSLTAFSFISSGVGSVGSVADVASVGEVGPVAPVGVVGDVVSVGAVGSVASVGAVGSVGLVVIDSFNVFTIS